MTRPLRVGLFVMTFPQVSETFIVTKLLKMLDAGIDAHVFCAVASTHWQNFEVLRDRADVRERVHILPPTHPLDRVVVAGTRQLAAAGLGHPARMARLIAHTWRHRREPASRFLAATYLKSAFVGFELDVLHVEFDAQAIGIADLKEIFGCKLLLSGRGTFQQLSTLDSTPEALAYLFRYVDGYHFISRFLERNMRELGLPPTVPTWLIEPAIDLALFSPPAKRTSDGPLRVISVGRLSWEKGYETALHTIASLRTRGIPIEYTIYGEGPARDAIRYAVRQLGLDAHVELAGNARREMMPAAYAAADVMLHTAVAEGFCNAVVEAQAMELPCVVSDAGGLPENVDHGVTGYVVARRDVTGFVDRLVELAQDAALRRRLGEAGRARALIRFDLDRQADAFLRLYEELARK